MTKEVIIICLIILVIYLYYQQNNQPVLVQLDSQVQEIQDLKQQVNHYQNLYQKRVAKDLEVNQTAKIKGLQEQLTQRGTELQNFKIRAETEKNEIVTENETKNQLFQQKITDLEKQLLDLAKQKLTGKKEAQKLLNDLETNWSKKQIEYQKEQVVFQEKIKKLNQQTSEQSKLIHQQEQTIIGLNNSYEKLAEQNKDLASNWKKAKENWTQEKNQLENQLSAKQEKLIKSKEEHQNELKQRMEEKNQQIKDYQTKLEQEQKKLTSLGKSFADLQAENKTFLSQQKELKKNLQQKEVAQQEWNKEKKQLVRDAQEKVTTLEASLSKKEDDLIKFKELNKKFNFFIKEDLGINNIEETKRELKGQKLTQIIKTVTDLTEEVKDLKKFAETIQQSKVQLENKLLKKKQVQFPPGETKEKFSELLRRIKILFADDKETNYEVESPYELLTLLNKRKQELLVMTKELENLRKDLTSEQKYLVGQERLERWRKIFIANSPHFDTGIDPSEFVNAWSEDKLLSEIERWMRKRGR